MSKSEMAIYSVAIFLAVAMVSLLSYGQGMHAARIACAAGE